MDPRIVWSQGFAWGDPGNLWVQELVVWILVVGSREFVGIEIGCLDPLGGIQGILGSRNGLVSAGGFWVLGFVG